MFELKGAVEPVKLLGLMRLKVDGYHTNILKLGAYAFLTFLAVKGLRYIVTSSIYFNCTA